jgi:hypothetical protein
MHVASMDRPVKEKLTEEPPSHADQDLQGTFNGQKGAQDTTTLNVAALGTMYTIKKHVPKNAVPAEFRTLDQLPGVIFSKPDLHFYFSPSKKLRSRPLYHSGHLRCARWSLVYTSQA